jgi:hypothetical protein
MVGRSSAGLLSRRLWDLVPVGLLGAELLAVSVGFLGLLGLAWEGLMVLVDHGIRFWLDYVEIILGQLQVGLPL